MLRDREMFCHKSIRKIVHTPCRSRLGREPFWNISADSLGVHRGCELLTIQISSVTGRDVEGSWKEGRTAVRGPILSTCGLIFASHLLPYFTHRVQ